MARPLRRMVATAYHSTGPTRELRMAADTVQDLYVLEDCLLSAFRLPLLSCAFVCFLLLFRFLFLFRNRQDFLFGHFFHLSWSLA